MKNRKGITVIQVIVILAIIGMLISIVISISRNYNERQRTETNVDQYVSRKCINGHLFIVMRETSSLGLANDLDDDGRPLKCLEK